MVMRTHVLEEKLIKAPAMCGWAAPQKYAKRQRGSIGAESDDMVNQKAGTNKGKQGSCLVGTGWKLGEVLEQGWNQFHQARNRSMCLFFH